MPVRSKTRDNNNNSPLLKTSEFQCGDCFCTLFGSLQNVSTTTSNPIVENFEDWQKRDHDENLLGQTESDLVAFLPL